MIDEKKLIEKIEKMVIPLSTPDGSESIDIGINGYNECLVDVLETIKAQPKIGEWIPFNKKEPKEEGLYLCCFDDGFITTVEYEDGDWNLWADSGEVVAWQSLPEPFKGETE